MKLLIAFVRLIAMRCFIRGFYVLLLLGVMVSHVCAEPPKNASSPLPPDVEAINLLLHGRRFERAAELLQTAIAKKPADYNLYVALGCAYADRILTLIHAHEANETLRREQKEYPNTLKEWLKEPDKKNEWSGTPYRRPSMPPAGVLPTLDDNMPYRLTRKE